MSLTLRPAMKFITKALSQYLVPHSDTLYIHTCIYNVCV